MMQLPILGDDKDERFEGVILLDSWEDGKTTAVDRGDYWVISDWEIMSHDGSNYWFIRGAYTFSKGMVRKLYEAKNPTNV